MIGLKELFMLIQGILAFPKEIGALIELLKKTPQEQHEDIVKSIQKEAENFEKTGRPSWD